MSGSKTTFTKKEREQKKLKKRKGKEAVSYTHLDVYKRQP